MEPASSHLRRHKCLCFSAIFRRACLPAQIKRAVNQAYMAIGLGKIAQHVAGQRIHFIRKQAHVVPPGEQSLE